MNLSKIYISNPYPQNELTERLYNLTVDNVLKMYPNVDTWASFEEDYRQKNVWFDIEENKNKLDVVCVVTSGNIFLKPDLTFELVKQQVGNKTWWALGHFLDRVKSGVYLRMFNSCYFINVQAMNVIHNVIRKDGNKVLPGYRPNGGIGGEPWTNFERSSGNHHDDYTPHWIRGSEGFLDSNLKEHGGSVLIHEGFQKGIQFESFNQRIRDSKEYCYMDMDDMDGQTWQYLSKYLDTNSITNNEEDDNYWWFYRHSNL